MAGSTTCLQVVPGTASSDPSVFTTFSIATGEQYLTSLAMPAYAAAMESRDRPLLATVAVAAAELAQFAGRPRDVAFLIGAAARLRGTHDRTDRQIQAMLTAARTALGEAAAQEAYQAGWQLDGTAASTRVDPALLGRDQPGELQARRA